MKTEWILCPVCGNKTRTMIQENTEMRNFPLYCPKCKKETIINVQDNTITAVFPYLSAISVNGFFALSLGWFLPIFILYLPQMF